MLWCQGAQKIGVFNRKLKSALKYRMITMQARPSQTDEHHGNSATRRSNERIAR